MSERILTGVSAAPGIAIGLARLWDRESATDSDHADIDDRPRAAEEALAALAGAEAELEALADRMRLEGRASEADVIESGAMMAMDPLLHETVRELVLHAGRSPAGAIREAVEGVAAQLDALEDPMLAARAADVRSLGRRAARLVTGDVAPELHANGNGVDGVVIASDLGPADVAEFGRGVRALVLADGGLTGHAAIVARSLGLPMVIGLGPGVLALEEAEPLIVDGDRGVVVASPDPERLAAARRTLERRSAAALTAPRPGEPTFTRDGRRVRVLANVSGHLELEVALAAGAEGVGLLRTELAFLDAPAWPSFEEQRRALESTFALLAGRIATVRLFDFGGDKTPPFLRGARGRGVELLLDAPEALTAQLEAVLALGAASELRVLIPMVTDLDQVRAVRARLRDALRRRPLGHAPLLGAMIETPTAVAIADRLASDVGLVSIGTNDLTSLQLGLERTGASAAPTYHPEVLRLIATTAGAAQRAGIVVEVCGEAASDPQVMPLLVGLGVDELSVGAARVATVRSWVTKLDYAELTALAARALAMETSGEVELLVAPIRRLLVRDD
jgi:phosphoenolpyruvate-protein kinase (PTS system EI component)